MSCQVEGELLRHVAEALARCRGAVGQIDAGHQRLPSLGRSRPHSILKVVDCPPRWGRAGRRSRRGAPQS